jgi:hypothetical protein
MREDVLESMEQAKVKVTNVLSPENMGVEFQPSVIRTDPAIRLLDGVIKNKTYPGVDVDLVERYRAPDPDESYHFYPKSGRHWKLLGLGAGICNGRTLSDPGPEAWRDLFVILNRDRGDNFVVPLFKSLWRGWEPSADEDA